MNRTSLAALVSINALLLAALAWVEWSPGAQAQSMTRSRNSYAMTGGTLMGVPQGVVYIVSETDQELVALMWNERTKQFQGLGYRNIAADLSSAQRVRP